MPSGEEIDMQVLLNEVLASLRAAGTLHKMVEDFGLAEYLSDAQLAELQDNRFWGKVTDDHLFTYDTYQPRIISGYLYFLTSEKSSRRQGDMVIVEDSEKTYGLLRIDRDGNREYTDKYSLPKYEWPCDPGHFLSRGETLTWR